MNPMSDDDFINAFMSGSLPNHQFHHRDHLRLTWCLVRRMDLEAATDTITHGIRRFAAHHGHSAKYHETMTQFWVRIVDHTAKAHPEITTFDDSLAAFPHLLDKDLPYHHWRRETMSSPAARASWVEPDLLALPA